MKGGNKMGLITKEVETRILPMMCEYYQGKGYNLPLKPNGKIDYSIPITVKVKDLSQGSDCLVDTCCDNCGRFKTIHYYEYNKRVHQDGKIYCKSCYFKLFRTGSNHLRWNPDKTKEERLLERKYPEYQELVKKVLFRDNYTCQCCGTCNNSMEVHHLDGYNWCKERRLDVTNCITLCEKCHSGFHLIYGKGNNTKEQFQEWSGIDYNNVKPLDKELPKEKQIYCFENNKVYNTAKDCENDIKVPIRYIRRNCRKETNTAHGYHLIYFDDYNNLTEDDKKNYTNRYKGNKALSVICLTTNEIFHTIYIAEIKYGINKGMVSHCCKSQPPLSQHSGTLIDGTPLYWMYYSEFKQLTEEKQNNLLNLYKEE